MSLDLKHEWILKQTSFVSFYPFDMSCLLLSRTHCTRNKKPFVLEKRKKTLKEAGSLWLSQGVIHHIYQDIQKGPVLTLIFNGILTWTCRLIYDTSSQDRVNNTNISFTLFLYVYTYTQTFGVTTPATHMKIVIFLQKTESRVENYWW